MTDVMIDTTEDKMGSEVASLCAKAISMINDWLDHAANVPGHVNVSYEVFGFDVSFDIYFSEQRER